MLREALLGVGGAFRLAQFDARGLLFMNLSRGGAARSFWAAAIVAPAYVALLLLRAAPAAPDESLLLRAALETLNYVVGWTALPVALSYLLREPEQAARFPAFLCAWNWSVVVQMAAYLPAGIIADLGALPAAAGDGLMLGVAMAMMYYQWFIVRLTLGLAPLAAMGVVLLDLVGAAAVETAVSAVTGG